MTPSPVRGRLKGIGRPATIRTMDTERAGDPGSGTFPPPRGFLRWMDKLHLRVPTLTFVLLAILFLYPYFGKGSRVAVFLSFSFTAIVFAGVFATAGVRWRSIVAAVLGGAMILSVWIGTLTESYAVKIAGNATAGFFNLFLLSTVLRNVLSDEDVGTDTIFGAVNVYLMLGFAWTTIYDLLEKLHPGSFGGPGILDPAAGPQWTDLVYFSFVTLTTLGYGDITPATNPARSLALLESVTGVLCIAVLIGRLVGVYSVRHSEPDGGA